jgi:TetR/AcrR family transcriptional regulator, transcriptional repressor of aconitase
MPKRSQEYRDARREQILSAAKRCFVRNGFHETSMQDLFAEAGLSAGAVYRYFASKDEVILAIAEENLRDVLALIHTLATDPDRKGIGSTLASVLEMIRRKNAEDDLGPVAVLVWAEALRNPALHQRFQKSLTQLRRDLAKVVKEQQRAGTLPSGVGADGIASLLLAVVPGFILQLTLLGDASPARVGAAARALWPD